MIAPSLLLAIPFALANMMLDDKKIDQLLNADPVVETCWKTPHINHRYGMFAAPDIEITKICNTYKASATRLEI